MLKELNMLKKIYSKIEGWLSFWCDVWATARSARAEAYMRAYGVRFDADGNVIQPWELSQQLVAISQDKAS